MARTKLTSDQQLQLRHWLAAEYTTSLIKACFKARAWPELGDSALSYYRNLWAAEIETARKARNAAAITSGLALKEERVARLCEHADELEAIKWVPDSKGRYWNEKAWRETLDDIAREMGHRKQPVEQSGPVEIHVEYARERLYELIAQPRVIDVSADG